MNPVLSIILPTYNSAKMLEASLSSIERQSYKDIEVIIIDALSTDDTYSIVQKFSHLNIRWLSEKDAGIYDAMNKGIDLAKGDYLFFLGSDDTLYRPDTLGNIFSSDPDTDIIYGDVRLMPGDILEQGEWSVAKLLQQNINHQRIFYKASLFTKHDKFKIKYKVAADHELNIRLFCDPHVSRRHVPGIVSEYHQFGFSAEKTDKAFWNDWNDIFLKNFGKHLPEREIYLNLGGYCWYHIRNNNYRKAFGLFNKIFFKTFSLRFVKDTFRLVKQKISGNAVAG